MRMPVDGLQFAVAILLVTAPLAGQENPAPGGPAGPPAPPTELVFEREVFQYPAFERRNPFRALVGNLAGGPRSEQLNLRGIIWSAEPGLSVALFGTGIVVAEHRLTADRARSDFVWERLGEIPRWWKSSETSWSCR